MLSGRTRMVSIVHVSNTLGTINPIADIAKMAHDAGALMMVDGAQAMQHLKVNVRELGCDFYAFSGHKMFGPTGIGGLWGRRELLELMPPYRGGGEMIESVSFDGTTYAGLPSRFEAGTPNICGAVALGAAVEFLNGIDLDAVAAHEQSLLDEATERIGSLPGVTIVGTAPRKTAVVSFTMDGVHPHDIGTILDYEGVAIRTGHHCTQPLMERLGLTATARASFAMYNRREEIDALVNGLQKVREVFG